jgi:26S proteasome regulatory subunit T3
MATNRADTLDPALLRPGRLDRKIEFPLPARREKRLIFQTITSKMNLGPDVDLEDCEFAINQYHLLSPLTLLLQTCQDLIDCHLQRSHRLSKVLASKVRLPCIFFPSMPHSTFHPAVRKNRYVILPVDFEEAWKVSLVWLCLESTRQHIENFTFLFLSTSKRSRGVTRLTNSVSSTSCYICSGTQLMFVPTSRPVVVDCCLGELSAT